MEESSRAQNVTHINPAIYFELVEQARSIILKMDRKGRVVFANKYALDLFGYGADELIGQPVVGTIVPKTDSSGKQLCEAIANICETPEQYLMHENENITKSGDSLWVLWANTPSYNTDGSPAGVLCIGHDITERKQTETELNYLSTHDPLTDLYNRSKFDMLMEVSKPPMSIVIGDVDGLKLINDNLGHAMGDELLKNCATILRSCFRDGDVIARIGGDEFAVLLPTETLTVLEKTRERVVTITRNFNLEHPDSPPIAMSVGYARYGEHGGNSMELFTVADRDMYAQKDAQRDASYDAIHRYIQEMKNREG